MTRVKPRIIDPIKARAAIAVILSYGWKLKGLRPDMSDDEWLMLANKLMDAVDDLLAEEKVAILRPSMAGG